MTQQDFSHLSLRPEILENLKTLDYLQMTPIQAKSLGPILKGQDILAQAKTGSGKTAAFGIGLISKLNTDKKKPQALVLCPTRELADQVAKEIRKLARMLPNVKVLSLCGGSPIGPQAASLEHGAHCIVGTPGRVQDHLGKKTLNLRNVKTLVLDEADRMLDMGFLDTINQIIACTPNYRQTLLFSATYPDDIVSLSGKLQKNPLHIKVAESTKENDIEEHFFKTTFEKKDQLLADILGYYTPESSIIFCNTKLKSQELAKQLAAKGYAASAIHGDLDQYERDQVLALFANKTLSILVATDVAARGIDIKDLGAVINYELAHDPQIHIHRVGRTGRAGKKGLAFTLTTAKDSIKLENIRGMRQEEIVFSKPDSLLSKSPRKLVPSMISIQINGGKKSKLRPTDILGALTKSKDLYGNDVGKITIFDFHTIVAIQRKKVDFALETLSDGKIKGRLFKVKKI
ncbi:MAG: ATP-dependent RNA helicase DbpA [Oligoflexales bacterium]